MDAIKTIADSIRAERKAAAEEAAGSGTASAEDIKNAVAAGQDKPDKEPDKKPDKEPDKKPDKKLDKEPDKNDKKESE